MVNEMIGVKGERKRGALAKLIREAIIAHLPEATANVLKKKIAALQAEHRALTEIA